MKHVMWRIDLDADTPEEAARKALAIQRKPDSMATVFDVTGEDGETVRVDLDEEDVSDLNRPCVCDGCDRRYEERELSHLYPDIPDLLIRLDAGGIVPAGECPECGALVYPDRDPVRVLVLLDGGLVQDVLTDRPGVEAAVLNQDIEGLFDEDIETVTGGTSTLRGTLSAHEVTVAPDMIESAWRPVD